MSKEVYVYKSGGEVHLSFNEPDVLAQLTEAERSYISERLPKGIELVFGGWVEPEEIKKGVVL